MKLGKCPRCGTHDILFDHPLKPYCGTCLNIEPEKERRLRRRIGPKEVGS